MRTRTAVIFGLLAALAPAGAAQGRVYLTQEKALVQAFPAPQTVERRTLYLDDEQADAAGRAAGVSQDGRVIPYYVGLLEGRITGYAYFDTHLVRTLPETVMVLVAPGGSITRVEILSFDEPEDYLPGARWLGQFDGRALDPDLQLKRGIRTLTGATLSGRAITDASRRALALHRLFVEPPGSNPDNGGTSGARP